MKKKPRIISAPQVKQKLVEEIQDIFIVKVLGHEPGAYITDETRILDFRTFAPEKAIGTGKELGTLQFKWKVYVGPKPSGEPPAGKDLKNSANWQDDIFEAQPGPSDAEIIEKTKEVFAVDISGKLDVPLVDVYC